MKQGVVLAAAAGLFFMAAQSDAQAREGVEWMVFPTTQVHVLDEVMRQHGAHELYEHQAIPDELDPAWQLADDPASINHGARSALCDADVACRGAVNFTYFQTWLDVPEAGIKQLRIAATDIDDGIRVTLFNSAHPDGFSPRGAALRGHRGSDLEITGNLAKALVAGETNRIVLTHADDCCGWAVIENVQILTGEQVDQALEDREHRRRDQRRR